MALPFPLRFCSPFPLLLCFSFPLFIIITIILVTFATPHCYLHDHLSLPLPTFTVLLFSWITHPVNSFVSHLTLSTSHFAIKRLLYYNTTPCPLVARNPCPPPPRRRRRLSRYCPLWTSPSSSSMSSRFLTAPQSPKPSSSSVESGSSSTKIVCAEN